MKTGLLRAIPVLACLLALLFLPGRAQAVTLAADKGIDSPIDLSSSVEILLDPSHRLTIQDILDAPAEHRFVPGGIRKALPPYTNSTIWIRFSLEKDPRTPDDWVIELHPSWIDHIGVYATEGRQARLLEVLGDRHAFSKRSIKTPLPAFPVSVGAHPQAYYLEVRTHGPLPLVINAWRKDGLEKKELQQSAFYLVLTGGALAMSLVVLVFWVWIRDRTYSLFLMFIVATTLIIVVTQGYGSSLILPNHPVWADRLTDVMVCVFMAIATLFVSQIFGYRSHSVRAARVMNWYATLFAIFGVLSASGVLAPFIWWMEIGMILPAVANSFFLIRVVRQRKERMDPLTVAVLFVVNTSWVVFVCIQFALVRMDFAILQSPLIRALLAANLILLSVALAARLIDIELQRREEQQKALASMQLAVKALEDRSRQREFVAVISHEFRTPLAIVDAVSHALEVSPAGTDDRVKSSVKKIRRAIQRLSALIENLLVDDSLEASRPHAEREQFDLADALRSVQNNTLPDDQSRLKFYLPYRPLPLEGTQLRIEILLRNIIQNALKYSSSAVVLDCQVMNHIAVLDIRSFGTSIPASEQAQLFERYFRGSQSSRIPGSGLGLHIARTIARQHDGDVSLVSSDAQGTVFRISLPLRPAAGDGPSAIPGDRPAQPEQGSANRSVLR